MEASVVEVFGTAVWNSAAIVQQATLHLHVELHVVTMLYQVLPTGHSPHLQA